MPGVTVFRVVRLSLLALSVLAVTGRIPRAGAEAPEAEMRVSRNLAYAPRPGRAQHFNSLDLYAPPEAGKLPVMVFVHGGAWRIGDKRGVQHKPAAFTKKGWLFASINYRLRAPASWEDQARDVAASLAWIREHAARHGGDPDRIFIMGHSAGAHLAALVALDPRFLKQQQLPLTTIKGVVLLDGAGYDIPRLLAASKAPRLKKLYQSIFTEDPATQRSASPLHHVSKGRQVAPFLIIHVADREDSGKQSEALATALQAAGAKAEVFAATDKTHGTLNRELGTPDDPPTRAVFRFLGKLTGEPPQQQR